ncbi:MAG: type II toxin-antitoxin system VapC family toxin [Patescibacteria group bacterium]
MGKEVKVLQNLFNKIAYLINMTSLVIDTSVAIKWLNQDNEDDIDKANLILENVREKQVELLCPELLKYEIGNALLFGKKIDHEDIGALMKIFYSLPISFITMSQDIANTTYSLAQTLKITYYDASFLSIAEQYNAILVTENIKHQGKSKRIQVISLKDYR